MTGGDQNANHKNQKCFLSFSDSIVVFTHTYTTVLCSLCNLKTISVLKKILVGMSDNSFGLCKTKTNPNWVDNTLVGTKL